MMTAWDHHRASFLSISSEGSFPLGARFMS
jgi:hypothetical protein